MPPAHSTRPSERFWRFWSQRPGLAAALLFLLLALLFLREALFPPAGQVLGGYDMRGYYYLLHETARAAVHSGRLPLWTPYLFNGYPLLVDPQMGFFYPPTWPLLLIPVNAGVSWYMLFHIWLAGMGLFLFTRALGARWLPAVLAGIAFAFSGLLAGRLWAGHSTVYALDAWAGWILLALLWAVQRGGWWRAALAGLPFGLAILAGHLPSFLYMGLLWAAFALYLFLNPALAGRPHSLSRLLVLRQAAIMFAVGLALAAVQLLPFIQFSLQSARLATADYQFATDYSLPPAHLITLLLPQFFGEPLELGYWSVPVFEELTYYAGLLPLVGIVLALRRPSRLTLFYLLLMAGGLWLALGRYGLLYRLAYDFLPPFQLVRAPARAAFLFLFAAPALLAHTLSRWQAREPQARRAALAPLFRWTTAVVIVTALAAVIATGTLFAAVHPTDTSGRLWHQVGGYALALLILLLGLGLLWLYLNRPPPFSRGFAAAAGRSWLVAALLIILVTADMWLFAYKMVRLEPVAPDPLWQDAQAVLGEPTPRVLPWGVSIFIQNGALQTRLPSVFGYSSLEPAGHVAFAASVPDPRSRAYDVLGARYVIAPNPLEQFTEGETGLVLLEQRDAAWVYERPGALPVARLVYAAEVIADEAAATTRVHEESFDPATTAILDRPLDCPLPTQPPADAPPAVAIEAWQAGYWRLRTESTAPALLLLAESAYPGWQATIDGAPAEWATAYTTLRALCVPAGTHLVEWHFRPTIYWLGGAITAGSLLLLLVALVVPYRRRYRS